MDAETSAWIEDVPYRSRGSVALRVLVRNKKALIGSVMLLLLIATGLLAPLIAPYDPNQTGVGPLLNKPTGAHLMGTDTFGRDTFSRLLYGARISLLVAFSVAAGSTLIGVAAGLLTGYVGGVLDYLLMRLMDVLFAFPWVLMTLAIATILGPGLQTVLISLIVVYSPSLARLARSSALSVREVQYIEAARSVGLGNVAIIIKHILPNCLSPVLIQCTAIMGYSILAEAGISYLGLGTQPPTPSWGLSLSDGTDYMGMAPQLVIFPGLAIAFAVLSFNLLGDGFRDILDPRHRR
jgi:peptide/nickel transport system permease protein